MEQLATPTKNIFTRSRALIEAKLSGLSDHQARMRPFTMLSVNQGRNTARERAIQQALEARVGNPFPIQTPETII